MFWTDNNYKKQEEALLQQIEKLQAENERLNTALIGAFFWMKKHGWNPGQDIDLRLVDK